ncbi:rolling circle replication protein, Rep63 protein, partial [Acinetobacter oleivorans]
MPNSVNLTVNFTKPLKKPHFGKGVSALSEGSPASKSGALGKYTKVHAKPMSQGLQRSHDFILQDQSAKLLPKERVCNCLKRRIDKNKPRTVMFNENNKKAHWGNLQRCGSIWSCPVCAKKITESRRSELKNGLANWKQKHSGSVLLLTLTFSHSINQSLRENVL